MHVLPRRFAGLCLPAQETIGCGIPVLMPDIDPNNRWLPASWLLRTGGEVERLVMPSGIEFDIHRVDVGALAERILELARDDEQVRQMHVEACAIAEAMSWDVLTPRYIELLAGPGR